MKTNPITKSVDDLIKLREADMLRINREYQRGDAWNLTQKQKLIDSILRGYHLPVFYLHDITKTVGGKTSSHYEIVDGQQRTNAICDFYKGMFPLLDPHDPKSKFPAFMREENCQWANSTYSDLDPDLQDTFSEAKLSIAEIQGDQNEARDLFVRLQAGSDLKPQERRDALPGEFCSFVNELGGRLDVAAGHPIFRRVMGMKPDTDRGTTRQFVAQLAMTLFTYIDSHRFCATDKPALDDYYYEHVGFDHSSKYATLLKSILDNLNATLDGFLGPRPLRHEVLHMTIMYYQWNGKFSDDWLGWLPEALMQFKSETSQASKDSRNGVHNDHWNKYVHMTRSASDKVESITARHIYFMNWMLQYINPKPIDPKRSFDAWEREYVYLRDGGRCRYASSEDFCRDNGVMDFRDAHIHHVNPHSKGGKTELDNAVLTHQECNHKIGDRYIPPPGWTNSG